MTIICPACGRCNLHRATRAQFKERVWFGTHRDTSPRSAIIQLKSIVIGASTKQASWYSCPVFVLRSNLEILLLFIKFHRIINHLSIGVWRCSKWKFFFWFFSFSRTQIERLEDGLNVLHVLNVDHGLSGEVKCHVTSRNNPKIFNVYHTTLTVLPVPISERYEPIESVLASSRVKGNCSESKASSVVHDLSCFITKRPDDKTVLVGDSIELNVSYIGYPVPTVRWMRAVSN